MLNEDFPFITIVMPIYNASSFLEEAINSVINQTFQNWELLLINDGSTDNSEEICLKYVSNKIFYYKQENQGVSVARNTGISKAKGEYIAFLDSDDSYSCNYLESSFNVINKSNPDLCIVGTYFLRDININNIATLPAWGGIVRREFLLKNNIEFPINIQPCEDGIFFHKIICLANKIIGNPDGIYNYRIHENQNHIAINKNCAEVLKQIPSWFNIINDFYTKYNIKRNKIYKILLFLEQEPFKYRFLEMPFTENEKISLYNMLKEFYNNSLKPYCTEDDYSVLTKNFKILLKSKDYNDYLNKKFIYIDLKYIPKKILNFVFSIKNKYISNKKYKVITVMGIKGIIKK